ncbi:MAG: histidine kinase [Turicibacter sp.]|nr:histidine kinase [Turicibacter sp.]
MRKNRINLFFDCCTVLSMFILFRYPSIAVLLTVLLLFLKHLLLVDYLNMPFYLSKNRSNKTDDGLSTNEKLHRDYVKYLGLQNQVNPHFLYNTLEGIRSEALIYGLPTVAEMVHLLAKYFRYNISNVDKLITIEEELKNIETYFSIQKFRFDDRIAMFITYDNDCEEEVKHSLIPKLILQPLIENAIQHGIEPLIEPGTIHIRFSLVSNRLIITVSDNGMGMSEEKLDALNDKIKRLEPSTHASGERGIALVNICKRIKLLFGDSFGLHFYSQENQGTDAELSVPFRQGGNPID